MISARTVATKILADVERNKGYSNISIDAALNSASLTKQDAALVSYLVYGVLQRKITLDKILASVSGSGFSKTHPFILQVLRVGAYQLLFSDKIPPSAAVNEAVKTVKLSKQKFASGFVNAVLRKIVSQKDIILSELSQSNDLSYRFSCDKKFVDAIITDYGKDVAFKFLEASLQSPKLYCRENKFSDTNNLYSSLSDSDISISKNDKIDGCFSIDNVGNIENLPDFKKGLFFVQDLASQLAIKALDIKSDMSLLDVCAAPGGKSFTAAQYVGKNGRIVSCDLYEKRAGLIKKGAERLKIDILTAIENDATIYNKSLGEFDRVICDVPCSGFGVIRRKPEIKYKSIDEFADLPNIQFEILQTSAEYLRDGGLLMYSTCTLFNRENRAVVDRFIESNNDFEIFTDQTLMPQSDDCDGFYYCILRRVKRG